MRRVHLACALGLLATTNIAPVSAQTITLNVDCSVGQSVAAAVARSDARKPLLVNVKGTCTEFLAIARDNVTIRGQSDGSTALVAPNSAADLVTIDGNGVTLEDLTLRGGAFGVRNNQSFSQIIRRCVIEDTRGDGVRVFVGDTRMFDSTVTHAGGAGVYVTRGGGATMSGSHVVENADAGIYVDRNSTVAASNSEISRNGSHGVQLQNNSIATLNGDTIAENGVDAGRGGNGITLGQSQATIGGGNTIRNNRQSGIVAAGGSMVEIANSTIEDNGEQGVFGYLGGTLVLHGNSIGRNEIGVFCSVNCTVQIAGATITENRSSGINLAAGSMLVFQGPLTHGTGNAGADLWCADGESSVAGLEWFDGSSPNCTGFD